MSGIFDRDLGRNEANFAPITPLSFIERAAEVYPNRPAVVHGELRRTWAEVYSRCRRLASTSSSPARSAKAASAPSSRRSSTGTGS